MGPFKVLARPAPNTYHRLEIPATWRACDEFNVERLRPYHRRRPDCLGPGVPRALLGRRRRAGVRIAAAAQVQDALGPALCPGALGGLRRVATSLTVRRPFPHSSGLRAALCHAPPRRRRLSPPPCLSPRQALPLMLRRRAISARSSWGGRCSTASTGGRPTGGSAVQSHASARAAPSRTWSPTHGRRLRCAALQTRSLMLPRMATVGSCFLLTNRAERYNIFDGSEG